MSAALRGVRGARTRERLRRRAVRSRARWPVPAPRTHSLGSQEARDTREAVNGSLGAPLPTTRSLLTREEEVLLVTRAQAGMALEVASERLALELGRLPSQAELALRTGLVSGAGHLQHSLR